MYESSRKGLAMHGTRHAVVVTHTRLRESGTVVEEAVEQLRRADFEVTIIDNIEAPDFGSKTPVVPKNTEIVVVLGGDGTILRAAELVHCTEVPILGVNLGHVGFLAEFESFQMSEAIRRIADHDYSIDERMIAHVDVWLPGATEPIEDWALNDITLERADRGKMVELSIRVDDVEMSSFGCDGVIVSTRPVPPPTRFRGRADHVAECESLAIGAVGGACVVRTSAHHRFRLHVRHRHSRGFHVGWLDLLRRPSSTRTAQRHTCRSA